MKAKVKFLGVYSTHNAHNKNQRDLFFAWQVHEGEKNFFRVQEIDESYAPKSKVRTIDQSTLSFFKFEPSILAIPMATNDEICNFNDDQHLISPRPGVGKTASNLNLNRPMQAHDLTIKYLGVYSKHNLQNKSRKIRRLFFVWMVYGPSDKYYRLQEINDAYAPVGDVVTIDQSLISSLRYEATIMAMPVNKPEEIYDLTRKKRQPPENKQAKDPAVVQSAYEAKIEKVIRNDFDEAMHQLNQPRARPGALRFIKTIPQRKEIKPSHKHMLRDFTVSLRKNSLPEIALMFASKTVELVPNDDHAHFNLARIYTMLGRYNDAMEHIQQALALNPQTEDQLVYQKMLSYIEKEVRRKTPPTLARRH